VTCAGQIDGTYSLKIVFTPLHWNMLVFIIFFVWLWLPNLSFGFGRFDLRYIAKMSISLILVSVGCEVAIKEKLVGMKTLV